eukprot:5592799-Pleurochrysis_carterae.AAC.2
MPRKHAHRCQTTALPDYHYLALLLCICSVHSTKPASRRGQYVCSQNLYTCCATLGPALGCYPATYSVQFCVQAVGRNEAISTYIPSVLRLIGCWHHSAHESRGGEQQLRVNSALWTRGCN